MQDKIEKLKDKKNAFKAELVTLATNLANEIKQKNINRALKIKEKQRTFILNNHALKSDFDQKKLYIKELEVEQESLVEEQEEMQRVIGQYNMIKKTGMAQGTNQMFQPSSGKAPYNQ